MEKSPAGRAPWRRSGAGSPREWRAERVGLEDEGGRVPAGRGWGGAGAEFARRFERGSSRVWPAGANRDCSCWGAALTGLANVVGGEGVFDGGEDALLGGAGQLADALEDGAGPADGAGGGARVFGLEAEEVIDGDGERLAEPGEQFGSDGDGRKLQVSDHLLGDAEFVGELRLGEPGGLAGGGEALAQGGAFGGSFHAASIRVVPRNSPRAYK